MKFAMNRRRFLLSASGLAVAAAEEPKPSRIIDVHTHFYDPARPQGVPWPGKNDPILYQTTLPDRYRKIVEPLGVTGTIDGAENLHAGSFLSRVNALRIFSRHVITSSSSI